MVGVDSLPLVCDENTIYLLQRWVFPFVTPGVETALQVTFFQ
jgi:hypothetical protein